MKVWLALALLASPAAAQEPRETPPPTLTLDEAIAIASRNNPQYLQTRNDADVAAAQLRANYGAFMPTLDANLGIGASYNSRATAEGDFGEIEEVPDAIISKSSTSSQGLSLSMNLFDGGAKIANLGASRANQDAVDARVAAEVNRLAAEVQRRYFAAVRAEQQIEVAEQQLAFAEDRLDITEQQFRIAAARQSDVLGARGDVARQRQVLSDALANARAAKLDLLQSMGLSGAGDFQLATDFPEAVDPASLDADALVARALSSNPTVVAASAARLQQQKAASAAKGQRWPSISMSASFGRSTARPGGYYGAWDEFNPPNQGVSFSLGASLPLFSGFQTSANIASAAAAAEDAAYDERLTRLQAERDVRTALIELERTYQALLLADEEASLAAQRLELAQQEYQAGVTTMNFTALQQITQLNEQAQRGAVDARFNYANARITLEERLGSAVGG